MLIWDGSGRKSVMDNVDDESELLCDDDVRAAFE